MPTSAEPQSFCFGKLPLAGDFIRGDGPVPEFAELDDWIQHGMYESQRQLGGEWQRRFDALPPARFLWTAGRGTAIAGWWLASRDAVGRRYPFVLAARVPDLRPGDYALLPTALADWFADARALLDGAFAGLDVVGTITAADRLPCRLDLDRAREHQAGSQPSWAGHDEPAQLLLHDLEQVAAAATPPSYSLRWPSEPVDLSFWLAAMAWFGSPTPRLVLWHGDANARGVARVVIGELRPKLFSGVIFFDRDDDDAYDLGRGADAARLDAASRRFGAAASARTQAEAIAALPQEGR
jgi:type VI secretion system ImpM family protein